MVEPSLEVANDGAVRVITLTRTKALNAFTPSGFRSLAEELCAADADPRVSVVLMTGAGRAFTVGADRANWEPEHAADVADAFTAAVLALSELSKPLIVAVNGYAIGFGATLLGLADLVIVADDVKVRTPFAELGTVAEGGSSVTFPALLGYQRAFWMLASGPWLSAADCVDWGLALRACPADELLDVAMQHARGLAVTDPAVLQATKKLLTAGRSEQIRSALIAELSAATHLRQGSTD